MAKPRYDVFLSHNSKDKPAVERIAEKLRQHKIEPWLDKWYLAAGKSFQDGIDAGLKAAGACAVFLSEHGPGQWQRAELEVAQDRAIKDPEFTLFLVLLPGLPEPFDVSTLPSFLNMRSWVDLRGGFEDPARFQALINAIAGVPMGPATPVALERGVSPYRGLQVFDEEHAEFFFGREADVQRLLEKLKTFRFLAVIGPSGSGKSSLVRAGLLPSLKNGALPGSHDWPVRVFTPGARPLAALAAQLVQIDPERPMGRTLDELRESPRTLDLAATLLLDGRPATTQLVLVIDQFEEIFTLCTDDAERAAFLGNVLHAATVAGGRCLVILTMRADFYPRCAAYPDLATLLAAHQVLLGPLSEQGIRSVIVEPARRVGVSFEPGLVDTILGDVGREPGFLPLLEHALLELWERRQGDVLTLAGYRESGGVGNALATRADTVFNQLDPAEQAVARRVLLRLTQPGEETEDTRRRADLDELITRPAERETVEHVLDQLIAARLLTTGQQADDGEVQVDVAHEALIRAWPRLRAWLDEDREGLRVHRRLTEAAQEWDEHQRDPDLLYRGARLSETQALASRHADLLNQQESAFLAASAAAREREIALAAANEAAQERQRRRILIGLALFSVVALALAGLAGLQWRAADAETRRADSERAAAIAAQATAVVAEDAAITAQGVAEAQTTEVARERNNAFAQATQAAMANATAEVRRIEAETARAESEQQARVALARQLVAEGTIAQRPDLRLLLILESMRLEPDSLAAPGALFSALVNEARVEVVLGGERGSVWKSKLTPDGMRLVTAGIDGLLRQWEIATGEPVGEPWRGHEEAVWSVAISPDGSRAVSGGQDGGLILWDRETGTPIGEPWITPTGEPWPDQAGGVIELAFSPDGTRVASAGQNGLVAIWDVATGEPVGEPLPGLTKNVWTVAFSPDGERLMAAGDDDIIVAWDAATGEPIGEPWPAAHQTNYVLAFSPDGSRVAAGGGDGTLTIWDVAIGEPVDDAWQVHPLAIYGLVFTADGSNVASASGDQTIVVTDAATGERVGEPWQGHQGTVIDLSRNGDGSRLASASDDGAVIIWTLPARSPLARSLPGTGAAVMDLALSPDGSRAATIGPIEVAIWDTATGERVGTLDLPASDSVMTMDFSPNGSLIATGNQAGAITLWDAATGQASGGPWPGHEGRIWGVDVSPDGTRLLSAGNDGSVILWNLASGERIGKPWRGHPDAVSDVAFSLDGTRAASVGVDLVLWDVATGERVNEAWPGDAGAAWRVAFSPDGTTGVAATIGGALVLWDATTGQPIGQPWRAHEASVSAVAFSPDGSRVVSADYDGRLVLWDVATGTAIGEPWPADSGILGGVAFTPDGSQVAAAGEDGIVTFWDISEGTWREAACHIANRNLSQAEWEQFLGGQPYQESCPGKRAPDAAPGTPESEATPV